MSLSGKYCCVISCLRPSRYHKVTVIVEGVEVEASEVVWIDELQLPSVEEEC